VTIYSDNLNEQMSASRFRNGRFERLVNGEWVEWKVLKLDKWAHEEVSRTERRKERRDR